MFRQSTCQDCEEWQGDADIRGTFKRNNGGYEFQGETYTEVYSATGVLAAITDPHGNTQTLTYDTQNRLDRVDTNTGEFLIFGYDTNNRIATLTDHTNRIWHYRYDAAGNLEYVDNPDGTSKRYHYEDTRFPHALTGITDERGVRYATYGYDDEGRANLSTHANNAQRVDIVYNADGTRTVTNSRNQASTYSTAVQLGVALVTDISGPGCSTCGSGNTSYNYDPANNNLLSKTENGITTQYGDYDAKGQYGYKIEAVGTPEQRRTDYTYDPRFYNKIATITEPSVAPGQSKTTTYAYDDWGNRLSETVDGFRPDGTPVSRTTTWRYDGPLHQLSQADGPRTDVADITTYEYYADAAGEGANRARLRRVADAHGVALRDNIQYTATGKVLSELRPNGMTLIYTYYPGNDRLETLTESVGGVSRVTRWTYLATGEVESITQGYGTTDATTLSFGYDDARRLTRLTDGLGNYIEYQLDTEGNREAERIYDAVGVLRKQLTQTFDLYNRLDTSAQANESRNPDYAPDGTLDRSTDGAGRVTDYSYDALKRLTRTVQDQTGSDPTTASATTQYDYDTADRLTRVTDPGNGTTLYVYDDLGNLLSQTSPDTGTTGFTHDAAGNITTRTTARAHTFSYTYDALNRLTLQDGPGVLDDITYVYDLCAAGIGRVCSLIKNSGNVDYGYDGFGNVVAHQGIGYGYDAVGRVRTLSYPSGAVVTYHYDAAGRVDGVQLTRDGVTQDLASGIAHAPFGAVNALEYGNGRSLTQSFDSAYRLQTQSTPGVQAIDYPQYDANGNLRQRTDTLSAQTDSFSYDALDRLDIAAGGFGTRDYDYDKNGNRTRLNRNAAVTDYTYNANSNRLTGATNTSVQLDATGNTTFYGNRYHVYTPGNRLRESHLNWQLQGSYVYNGLGQRLSKTAAGKTTRFSYALDGALLVESGTGRTREYIYLDGQPLAVLDSVAAAEAGTRIVQTTTPTVKNGTVSLAWSGIDSPTPSDWVAVYPVGAADDAYLDWNYTGGTSSGSRSLPLNDPRLVAGQSYELRLYANDGYTRLATSAPFTLNPAGPTVLAATTPTVQGSALNVVWSGIAAPTPFDWVAIYAVGANDTAYMRWAYTGGTAAGSVNLPLTHANLVPGGSYEARLFANDDYTRLATSGSFVLASLAGTAASSTLYYVHTDHLGTPTALTNEAGTKVWSATHDPFGQATVNEDPDGNGQAVTFNVRFPGQYYDAETGLHYNYFRTYDPGTGRYLESDPIGLAGGLNTYGYALANPLKYFDPNGASATATWGGYTGAGGAAGEGLGSGLGSRALGALGPVGAAIGGMWPATMGDGTLGEGDTPYPGFDEPKQCDEKECDLEFVRETPSYDGKTKTCIYKRKGTLFTFPQAVGYSCPPIDREKCMVDTTYIMPPARY